MLRREHVDVQRRNVDRAIGAGEDAFRERTVEFEERSEQPVVSKDARIREEVVIRKDVENEQKTVSDTVRRTEVEVDDQRKGSDTTKRRRT
jgi:stress response protein YsnF